MCPSPYTASSEKYPLDSMQFMFVPTVAQVLACLHLQLSLKVSLKATRMLEATTTTTLQTWMDIVSEFFNSYHL